MPEAKLTKKAYSPGKIKTILQIVFFAVLTGLAIYYVLKDDPIKTFEVLKGTYFFPLILVFIVVFLASVLLESITLKLLTNIFNRQYKYRQAIINTMIGGTVSVFVKTGAPLIQAYTFSKQNVSVSNAASVLTMDFIMYQFSLFVYSVFMVAFGYNVMNTVPIPLLWDLKFIYLVYIGISLQALFFICALLIAYCRPLHRFVLNTGVNILTFLHIVKNPQQFRYRLAAQLATYRIEMKRLSQNKIVVLEALLISLIKQALLSMVPFLCFYALLPEKALNSTFFIDALFATGYIQSISSFLTVGIPEILFQDIFGYFLTSGFHVANAASIASAANILWRVSTFYFIFIMGLISYLCYRGSPKHHRILTNTQTIYDLSLIDLSTLDPDIAEFILSLSKSDTVTKTQRLLSKKEVETSFNHLRDRMIASSLDEDNIEEEPVVDENLSKILEEHKTNLAKIAQETEEMINNQTSQKEIEKETKKDLKFQKKKEVKRVLKKRHRETLKALRKQKREEKAFLHKQPKGAIVSFNEKTGIQISSEKIIENHKADSSAGDKQ